MQRYSIRGDSFGTLVKPDPSGEFVRCQDVAALEAAARAVLRTDGARTRCALAMVFGEPPADSVDIYDRHCAAITALEALVGPEPAPAEVLEDAPSLGR